MCSSKTNLNHHLICTKHIKVSLFSVCALISSADVQPYGCKHTQTPTRAATVYHKAQYSVPSYLRFTLLLSAQLFHHCLSITTCMLMTPSCLYPFNQICSAKTYLTYPTASAQNLGFIFDLTFSDQVSAVSWACFYHICDLCRIRPVLDFSIAHAIGTSLIHWLHCTLIFLKPS